MVINQSSLTPLILPIDSPLPLRFVPAASSELFPAITHSYIGNLTDFFLISDIHPATLPLQNNYNNTVLPVSRIHPIIITWATPEWL